MKNLIILIALLFASVFAFAQETHKTYYHHNGNLKNEGQYDDNRRRTGKWKEYYQSGKLWEVQNYEDGKPAGKFTQYYESGELYRTGSYFADKPAGEWKTYLKNGNLITIGCYNQNGKETGEWKEYDDNGKLESIRIYEDGKKQTWLNDRNQFLIPHTEPTKEFLNDCVVWSLFASSNETTALKNVSYLGNTYQIKNNFYPFRLEEIKHWEIKDPDFKLQIVNDQNRFVADWLSKNDLSEEAKQVIEKAKTVYKLFYANLNQMATNKWKIDTWDAGWYQIRRCLSEHNLATDELKELSKANEQLANKILPQIEEFGFLDKDEVYDEI
ncbi:MAG: toxin-antitoxin system YwqK family antitoxin [Pedobacter sp.]